jgi:hypothetical protein
MINNRFMCMFSGIMIIAGTAVFIVFYENSGRIYPLAWSTYITMVGGCVGFIAGVVFAWHLCLAKK